MGSILKWVGTEFKVIKDVGTGVAREVKKAAVSDAKKTKRFAKKVVQSIPGVRQTEVGLSAAEKIVKKKVRRVKKSVRRAKPRTPAAVDKILKGVKSVTKKVKKSARTAGVVAQTAKSLTPLSVISRSIHSAGDMAMVASGVKGRNPGELPHQVTYYCAFVNTAHTNTRDTKIAKLKEWNTEPWQLDLERTNKYLTVWVKGKTVIITFRGTDPHDLYDLHADFKLATGAENTSKRYLDVERWYRKIQVKYPREDQWYHILASHSLGGGLNMFIADKYTVDQVHNYNPGSSIRAVYHKAIDFSGATNPKKIFSYIIENDPISTYGKGGVGTTMLFEPLKGSVNPHALQQFLN